MRISDWSSDVCSSDLQEVLDLRVLAHKAPAGHGVAAVGQGELRTGRPLYRHPGVYAGIDCFLAHLEYEDSHLPTSLRSVSHSQLSGERLSLAVRRRVKFSRSEEHTSELQPLMRISYAVFCLKKTNQTNELKSHTDST